MSYQKGLKSLLSGMLGKPADKGFDLSASKDPKKVDHGYTQDKNDGSGISIKPIVLKVEEDGRPAHVLKRKEATMFKPVDPKEEAEATEAPASPSSSVASSSELSTASTASTASTIVVRDPNRPGVHFFCYETVGPHGSPDTRKLIDEVTLAGFNDEDTEEQLLAGRDDPPYIKYAIPRLYMASYEELVEDSEVTSRSVSGYVEQITDRNRGGSVTRSNNPADRLTMGAVNTANDDTEYFFLRPDDLVVMEATESGFRSRGVPWAGNDHHIYPFAHPKYLENAPPRRPKNFAWEWIRFVDKPAYRPLHAAPGVQLWLIDYELRRRPHHRRQTEVEGRRQVFYGRGVRFVEVRPRDEEWRWKETRRWTALVQVKMWRDKKKALEDLGALEWTASWPEVGVLACELGDF